MRTTLILKPLASRRRRCPFFLSSLPLISPFPVVLARPVNANTNANASAKEEEYHLPASQPAFLLFPFEAAKLPKRSIALAAAVSV